MLNNIRGVIKLLVLSTISTLPSYAQGQIQGTWLTQKPDHNARIHIESCSAHKDYQALINAESTDDDAHNSGDKLCGRIVWLAEPTYQGDDSEAGQPKHDRNNSDESMQSRPIMNMPVLYGFNKSSDREYINGHIYNPEDGDTYKCTLTLIDDDKLEVRGFVELLGFKPGKTQIWKRWNDNASRKDSSSQ